MDQDGSKVRPKRRKLTFSQYYNASQHGAVPLREIKRQLLAFRRAGKLERVKRCGR